jgi:hypothetical protein
MQRFPLGMIVPVDDLRTWVVSGLAESVPWTDETERQFKIAEAAVCDVVRRYHEAGFAVAIDHCRNLPTLEALISKHLADLPVTRICLMPELETNLDRSHTRTNKPFDPHMLDETIQWTNTNYRLTIPEPWHVLDNTHVSVEATVTWVLDKI